MPKVNSKLFYMQMDDSPVLILFISLLPFTLQCRKMVRHTLKTLQQMLQDFQSVSDHFTTLQSKGLITISYTV